MMRNQKWMFNTVAAALLAGTSTVALAADQTSVTTGLYDKIAEKAALTYFGVYRGASLNDPSNSLQPGVDGVADPKAPQSLESLITGGYKLNKDTMIGAAAHFYYFPVGNPVGTGQNIQMLDPSLVFSRANLIDNHNGFHLKGLLSVNLPLTNADFLLKNNLATSISPTVVISWDVPKTKLNLGIYSYLTAYVPTASAADDVRTYKLYVAPNAAYSLSKSVQATMWVDLIQGTRKGGTPFFAGMDNYTMDIEPGLNWDINKFISINPMLNIYPGNATLASTSIQAVIIGKAF